MYEVDFLPVENDEQDGGKSGDAIAVRFTVEAEAREAVIIIDGGRAYTSEEMISHVRNYYNTEIVDLMISTHPDADHLNGLTRVVEELEVRELLVHQPRLHTRDVSEFSNLEALDGLLKTAASRKVSIMEPFTGCSRFQGQLRILGPTETYYENLLREQLAGPSVLTSARVFAKRALSYLGDALSHAPEETLDNLGETSPRNNSSVVTLLTVDDARLLFTGDAGIPALDAAANYYESIVGPFSIAPLRMFQAPHHGSKHNLGPAVLDRILGPKNAPHSVYTAMISSAKASEKHPSPKVTNALSRRGCLVIATEGKQILHGSDYPSRFGWGPAEPIPWRVEEGDDD